MDNGQAYPGGQQVPVGNNQAFAPGPVGLGRTQPISSGTGDIILQPEKKRSTKKRWIAGVVAGIIVAVITLLVLLASRSGQVNGKSISEYAKDYLSLLAIGKAAMVILVVTIWSFPRFLVAI